MQSVPIITSVVSSNPAQTRCTWYNIMRILILVNDLRKVSGFLWVRFLYQYNKGNNKITELRTILQKESQNS